MKQVLIIIGTHFLTVGDINGWNMLPREMAPTLSLRASLKNEFFSYRDTSVEQIELFPCPGNLSDHAWLLHSICTTTTSKNTSQRPQHLASSVNM